MFRDSPRHSKPMKNNEVCVRLQMIPNCYSKVVEIVGHKHIIIFALRRILSGEELTYDYKFPFEEDKIPCTCGAKRCRKFLN
ncbi:hypothetical protein D910_11529 [Dendroctonus ponderosae]|uniref:Post-SET domain-containing protein n=1 Tax=Dendroctonus ponderosae TaxID=77166 RepID=U4UP20_DENPD|nr:hypothetical protein D910_11529 [Dendroctonus ponderosae]